MNFKTNKKNIIKFHAMGTVHYQWENIEQCLVIITFDLVQNIMQGECSVLLQLDFLIAIITHY